MTIDLRSTFDYTRTGLGASRVLGSVFGSTLWTAVVVAVLVMLVVLIAPPGDGAFKTLRFVAWSFLAVLGALFLHDCVLDGKFRRDAERVDRQRLVDQVDALGAPTEFRTSAETAPLVVPIGSVARPVQTAVRPISVSGGVSSSGFGAGLGLGGGSGLGLGGSLGGSLGGGSGVVSSGHGLRAGAGLGAGMGLGSGASKPEFHASMQQRLSALLAQ